MFTWQPTWNRPHHDDVCFVVRLFATAAVFRGPPPPNSVDVPPKHHDMVPTSRCTTTTCPGRLPSGPNNAMPLVHPPLQILFLSLRGRPPDSLLLKDTSCLGNLCRLTPSSLWNTLLCYCSAYFSSNMIEVGFTLAMDHQGKFTYHSSDSGLHGLMILSLGSSNTITFFPHVVSSWLVRTRTLFSLKFIMLMFIGKGSVSNFIFCLSPNVKRPSFSADFT
jgi:hypothetical protein